MNICVHCIVEGQVQGVFFRASTQKQAEKLGLTGFAYNRVDGSVEVLACGEQEVVAQLCEWLKSGPPAAQVESVSCRENELLKIDNFSTG
ncbi:Acylphosphate phosphohydrolase, putative [hydrothermal vent metagenome]|uniref:Acylphosphate phosphohydrolase, putative n=1 Tax=hydrothermal vent metagenome TaxID=652676 RepID=A0A3B1BN54_9ZZZZ